MPPFNCDRAESRHVESSRSFRTPGLTCKAFDANVFVVLAPQYCAGNKALDALVQRTCSTPTLWFRLQLSRNLVAIPLNSACVLCLFGSTLDKTVKVTLATLGVNHTLDSDSPHFGGRTEEGIVEYIKSHSDSASKDAEPSKDEL